MPAALPAVPGLELDCYFRPLGAGNEVGGDFYDVFADRDGCWLVVGDVCGKGAEAAVITAFLRHTTAAYARDGGSPASVLARVNRAMLEQEFEGRFATAILARLDYTPTGGVTADRRRRRPPGRLLRAQGGSEEFGEERHAARRSSRTRASWSPRPCSARATRSRSTPTASPRPTRRHALLSPAS